MSADVYVRLPYLRLHPRTALAESLGRRVPVAANCRRASQDSHGLSAGSLCTYIAQCPEVCRRIHYGKRATAAGAGN